MKSSEITVPLCVTSPRGRNALLVVGILCQKALLQLELMSASSSDSLAVRPGACALPSLDLRAVTPRNECTPFLVTVTNPA